MIERLAKFISNSDIAMTLTSDEAAYLLAAVRLAELRLERKRVGPWDTSYEALSAKVESAEIEFCSARSRMEVSDGGC